MTAIKTKSSRKIKLGVVIPIGRKKQVEVDPIDFLESIQLVLEVADQARTDATGSSVLRSERLKLAIRYLKNYIGGQ